MTTFPAMVSEDYQTHEDFCAEYSDTEVVTHYFPMPDWVSRLERTDTPLTTLLSGSPDPVE